MNFNVTFSTNTSDESLVEKMGRPGLDLLDVVREENPETKTLPAHSFYINNGCPINGSDLCVELTEAQARASGHFNADTSVDVQVEEHAFSKYVINTLEKNYSESASELRICGINTGMFKEKTKRLDHVRVDNKFDYDALRSDWAAAGHPLNWKQ